MEVYLIGFAISTLFFAVSEKFRKNQRWIFVVMALLIPCFIAGFRAETIGVDTEGYLVPMSKIAISSKNIAGYMEASWYRIWRYLYIKNYEIGFSLLVYIAGKIFHSIVAVQFFVQAFTVVPIYLAVRRRKEYPTWLCMLVYYLLIFNTTLNMMRQAIAMAFVILALQYFIEKNIKKFIILIIVGFLFHYSALIGVVVAFIYMYVQMDSQKDTKIGFITTDSRYFNMIVVILIGIGVLLGSNIVFKLLPIIGMGRYSNYIAGMVHVMPNQIISRLPLIFLFVFNWKRLIRNEKEYRFYFTMLCMDLICSQFTSVNIYGGRISLYFSEYGMMSYPAICIYGKYKKTTRILLIAYMIFYWWFYFVFQGQDSTVPYLSVLG